MQRDTRCTSATVTSGKSIVFQGLGPCLKNALHSPPLNVAFMITKSIWRLRCALCSTISSTQMVDNFLVISFYLWSKSIFLILFLCVKTVRLTCCLVLGLCFIFVVFGGFLWFFLQFFGGCWMLHHSRWRSLVHYDLFTLQRRIRVLKYQKHSCIEIDSCKPVKMGIR